AARGSSPGSSAFSPARSSRTARWSAWSATPASARAGCVSSSPSAAGPAASRFARSTARRTAPRSPGWRSANSCTALSPSTRDRLQSCLALARGQGPEAVRRTVGEQLLALDPGFGEAIPLVLAVLGVADEAAPPGVAPSTAGLAGFIRRLVRRQSRDEPVVLL